MLDPHADQRDPQQLADAAAALQAELNLWIGWATITGRPVSPKLYDANVKLVEVGRQLHEVAQQASEDGAFRQGVREAEQAADWKAAVNGA
jgi:predicted TIM-barrel fold metal-dependent hydrolase